MLLQWPIEQRVAGVNVKVLINTDKKIQQTEVTLSN